MWWKIYFWLWALLLIIGTLLNLAEFSPNLTFSDFIYHLKPFIEIVGLYGFAYRKRVLIQYFWRYYLIFCVLYTLIYIIYPSIPEGFVPDVIPLHREPLDILVFNSIMIFPLYLALFLYAFRSKDIWEVEK